MMDEMNDAFSSEFLLAVHVLKTALVYKPHYFFLHLFRALRKCFFVSSFVG